jgi:hypothetical protein
MHLLVILLQQLLGMLPGGKKAPQPEAVPVRRSNPRGPDSAARHDGNVSQFRWDSRIDWMTVPPFFNGAGVSPSSSGFSDSRSRRRSGDVPVQGSPPGEIPTD